MQTLNDSDFKKKVISKTLCNEPDRADCQQLFRILFIHSKRLPVKSLMAAGAQNDPKISGMSYNSARDELFLADFANKVVRVRDNTGDLRDVYRAPHDTSPYIWSVCHISDSDTLFVCSGEVGPDRKYAYWLMALSRNGCEWREAKRVQTDEIGWISCALSDSRVLIGDGGSTYMELFRVESGSHIERVHRIRVPEEYNWFAATCDSDTLVAMSYEDKSVRVHRLRRDSRLVELARIQLKWPDRLLWLVDRLLVTDSDEKSHAVMELKVSDKRLDFRRDLIATSDNIHVHRMCAVNDGVAIFNNNTKEIHFVHYPFTTELFSLNIF